MVPTSTTEESLFRCSACQRQLPATQFNRCPAKPRGVDNYCKRCRREYRKQYYALNKDALVEKAHRQRTNNGPGTYPWVLRILIDEPCTHCGRTSVRRRFKLREGPRRFSLLSAKQNGVREQTVREELRKYDVVCGRCAPSRLAYAGAYSEPRLNEA